MSALCQTPPYTPSGFLPPQDCWKTYAFDELLDDSSNCRVILWELIHQIGGKYTSVLIYSGSSGAPGTVEPSTWSIMV
jgi:hypothetical protein